MSSALNWLLDFSAILALGLSSLISFCKLCTIGFSFDTYHINNVTLYNKLISQCHVGLNIYYSIRRPKATIHWISCLACTKNVYIFQNFAIMPLFPSAHAQNVTPASLGHGLGTTVTRVRAAWHCKAFIGLAAWYVVWFCLQSGIFIVSFLLKAIMG